MQVLDKFVGIDFTVEYKYDGERAQVHVMGDGRVAIYRRARVWRAANAVGKLLPFTGVERLLLACETLCPFCKVARSRPPMQPTGCYKIDLIADIMQAFMVVGSCLIYTGDAVS